MYESICYAKPFLKQVIARIDFVAPLTGLEKNLPQKLGNVASNQFPIAEPADAFSEEVELAKGELRHRRTQFKQWNFFGKEREKQLALAAPYIFITLDRYTTYENLKEMWTTVLDAVAKSFPDARAARFGLRYINNIEVEGLAPTNWANYISSDLLHTSAFFNEPDRLVRLFHLAELRYDDLQVKFQFGMPNPDYPAVMKRPQFVLDFDGYVQTAHELSESLHYMDLAHQQIQELFENSITDMLRGRMNAVPASTV